MKDSASPSSSIDTLAQQAIQRARSMRRIPESTYRLQLHKGFTFDDAIKIVPYLAKLGITHCYASPYLKSTTGSKHGYDVTEHGLINPEIGGEAGLDRFVAALKAHGMTHILDVVPNHAGVGSNENPWWNDVLENGPASRFAGYFDINWNGSPRQSLHGRVLLPLLGSSYSSCLEKGELKLVFDPQQGSFAIHYYQRRFPVSPCSYARVLSHRCDELRTQLPPDDPALVEFLSILTAIRHLPDRCENGPEQIEDRHRESQHIKRRLAQLSATSAVIHAFIQQNEKIFNGTPGDAKSFDQLDDLLVHQCFRLSYWANASDEINYRRFFDVNDLAALAMERQDVFEATHALILKLLADGKIAGLRIDHPDGLLDPQQYLSRLHSHFLAECVRDQVPEQDWPRVKKELIARFEQQNPRELYVAVEKILAVGESLPQTWPCDGTSGYEFLDTVNGLFVESANKDALTSIYQDFSGDATPFPDLVYHKKRLILETALGSELHMLTDRLDRIAQQQRQSRDFTFNGLRTGMREFIACFPVYRSYITPQAISDADRQYIDQAVERAARRNPSTDASVFHFIRDTLLRDPAFAGKFQQLTAPATAKGVEDTAFYINQRLVSLNEVGGDPEQFGISPDTLHQFFCDRQSNWPHALSTLSTHDTKRSEDVRARINVLSEIPDEWRAAVFRWRELNQPNGAITPDEEYLFYQMLLGTWPISLERIQWYMTKAMREAKLHTTWPRPAADHEKPGMDFIARALNNKNFLADFEPFQKRIARLGLINSLSQTLLKIAAPGVPDTYQGTEIIDLSTVDPDNRRPVDYDRRRQLLEASTGNSSDPDAMKMRLTIRGLNARRELAPLFSAGEYHPISVSGENANHVFAFARRYAGRRAICIIPRLIAKVPLETAGWSETSLALPAEFSDNYRNILTDEQVDLSKTRAMDNLLKEFPVVLLIR